MEKAEAISTPPLHCAALGGHADVVSFLIKDHTLDLDQQALLERKGYVKGYVNYSIGTPLHLAVIQGHIDVINVLIQAGTNINSKNFRGKTPLHLPFEQCNEEAISILIEAGADPNLVF